MFLLVESCVTGDIPESPEMTVLGVFEKKENALKAFSVEVEDIKADDWFYNSDGTLEEGMVEESTDDTFEVYEDGFYASNHFLVKVVEVKKCD